MAPQWQLMVYQSSRSLIPGSGELKASQRCHVLLPLIWTRCFGKGLTHCLRPCRGSGHRLTSPGILKVSRSTLHSALCERPSVSVGAHRSRWGLLHDWSGSRCASAIYTQLCVVVIIWLFWWIISNRNTDWIGQLAQTWSTSSFLLTTVLMAATIPT